jgi:type IV pilus assembly protein PilY1
MALPATTGNPAERIVSAALVKNFSTLDDRVIFTTLIPTTDPCDRGGSSNLMELKLDNGGAFTSPVIDTNNNGVIDSSDAIVAGVMLPSSLGITKSPLWLSGGAENSGSGFKFLTGSKGTTYSVKQTGDPDVSPGSNPVRVYWQEIR